MAFSVHIVGCLDLSKDCLLFDFVVFNIAMSGLVWLARPSHLITAALLRLRRLIGMV